jgi:hypothetical protein
MTMMQNASHYDWQTWMIGILRSAIAGGSTGVLNSLLSMGIDPQNINFTNGLKKALAMMFGSFILGGVVHMFIFLSTHSGPDPLQQALQAAASNVEIEAAKTAQHAQAAQDAASDVKQIVKDAKADPESKPLQPIL